MDFDLSYLYKSKTLNFGKFKVVISEIPHGAYADAQSALIAKTNVDSLDKNAINRGLLDSLRNGSLSASEFNDMQTISAIQSWSLKTKSGDDVPVCIEAYRLLPHAITEQIEKEIKALNPALDEEFLD